MRLSDLQHDVHITGIVQVFRDKLLQNRILAYSFVRPETFLAFGLRLRREDTFRGVSEILQAVDHSCEHD